MCVTISSVYSDILKAEEDHHRVSNLIHRKCNAASARQNTKKAGGQATSAKTIKELVEQNSFAKIADHKVFIPGIVKRMNAKRVHVSWDLRCSIQCAYISTKRDSVST